MKKDGLLIVSPIGEIIYRWLETAVIKRFDIECHIVTRATEGFKVARKMTPALIVIDDNLPDMNGMSFSAILRDMVEGAGSTAATYQGGLLPAQDGVRGIAAVPYHADQAVL